MMCAMNVGVSPFWKGAMSLKDGWTPVELLIEWMET